MNVRTFKTLLFFVAPLLGACTETATDTEGRHFKIDCTERPCRLLLEVDGAHEATKYSVESEGRYLLACAPEQTEFNCRPINCKTSDPCSTLGGAEFSCVGGYCENPSHTLTKADQLAACLATTGVWTGSAEQRARLSLVRSSTDASLPAACR